MMLKMCQITIVLTTLAILLCLINGPIHTVTTPAKLSKYPVVLVVSYDGFKYDYLDKVFTPNIHKLKAAGVSVPYTTPMFPSKTFPNHQSIATGLYTESHGIVDNTVFDPKYNKVLSGYTNDQGFWNYSPDVLPLWIQNELAGHGRASGCYMWPACPETFGANNDLLPSYYYPKYNASVPWESRVDTVISWITNDIKPANLVFLYHDEPDTHGHAFGPNSKETLQEVADADLRTGYLVNRMKELGIFYKVNLIMLSDHGFHEVPQKNIINMTALINPDLLQGKYGSSPLLQLVPTEGKKEELYETLRKNVSLGYEIFKKEDEKLKYRFRYSKSRRIAELVALADPGYVFDDFILTIHGYNEEFNLTASPTRMYGTHGYNNEAPSMRAYFIAHGPAFRSGVECKPIRIIDIAPLVGFIGKIKLLPNNGSLAHVWGMINPAFLSTLGWNRIGNQMPYTILPVRKEWREN